MVFLNTKTEVSELPYAQSLCAPQLIVVAIAVTLQVHRMKIIFGLLGLRAAELHGQCLGD